MWEIAALQNLKSANVGSGSEAAEITGRMRRPMSALLRGFNRSTQHLLILLDWEVAMEGNARTWFTPKQRAELWERWKSGQCVADIARALERRNKSGVYRVLAING